MATKEQALSSLKTLEDYIQGLPGPGPKPPPVPVDPRIKVINEHLNGQGGPILTASTITGLPLKYGCAVVEKESGGRNIFEETAPAPYGGAKVTPALMQSMINFPGYKTGDATMWGVGLTQLTFYTVVLAADALPGGASLPVNQCREGFKVLEDYMRQYPPLRALASYNAGPGENSWRNGLHYARDVMAKAEVWERRLAAEHPAPVPPGGEVISHGVVDGTNFAKGYKVALQLLGRQYWTWYSGIVPSGEGMYAVNRPLPSPTMIGRVNCTGLGNIMRRAAGKIVPTRGNENFDGGVAAYFYCPASFPGVGTLGPGFFSGVDVLFNMATAKRWAKETGSGVALGRSYVNNTLPGQGHFAVLLPDGMVLQSIPLGGVNIDYTIEESHGSGYYQWMIHPKDWINHDINNF